MSSPRRYAFLPDAELPDLSGLPGVATVDNEPGTSEQQTDADTPHGALASAGVSLRRTTGGEDPGWLLTAGDLVVHRPAGRSGRTVPVTVSRLVTGWTGAEKVAPTRERTTRVRVLSLRDAAGAVLATVHDASTVDTVGDERTDGRLITVDAAKSPLRKAIGAALRDAGATRPDATEDVTTDEPVLPEVNRNSPARALLQGQLVEAVETIRVGELRVRLREDDAVHQLRISVRRVRALFAVWHPLLDTEISEPVRARLHDFGAVLGTARDVEVLQERLVPLVQGEPTATRVGPVVTRVRRTLADERKVADSAVLAELDSPHHHALLAELAALAEEPPLTEQPGPRVAKVVPRLLARTHQRLARTAAVLDDPESTVDHDTAVHDVRKAARRARYAAEAFAGQAGTSATSYAATMESLQDVLGERQDALASCRRLKDLAADATIAGENAFTYGRLHASESVHVTAADAVYPKQLKKALRASAPAK